jgi:hypothetical protein
MFIWAQFWSKVEGPHLGWPCFLSLCHISLLYVSLTLSLLIKVTRIESWGLPLVVLPNLNHFLKTPPTSEHHSWINIFPFFFFETGSHYVVQAGLNLQSSYLSFLSARITGVQYHTWLNFLDGSV